MVLVVHVFESLESHLILVLFVLDVTEFFEFVMADLQWLFLENLAIKGGKGSLSLVRGLEAHESICFVLLVNGEHLDALNFALSVVAENVSEVLFSVLGLEVLDIEVASLLRVLVFDCLTEKFFLTLGGAKGGLDVEDLAIAHVFSVKSFNGF
jgi:hypothetical protein